MQKPLPPSIPSLEPHSSSTTTTKLPLNRIKKIMQANKEIGKIQSSTPLVIAKALELFLEDLTKTASSIA